MLRLLDLLRSRSTAKLCVRAYQLFLEELSVDEVFCRLRAEGFSEHLASRAVTFLPSAFARRYYAKEGLTFPERFFPGAKAYRERKSLRYEDEAVFHEAMQLAAQLTRDGNWPSVWRLIEISAEHAGVTKARSEGLTPTSFSMFIHEF